MTFEYQLNKDPQAQKPNQELQKTPTKNTKNSSNVPDEIEIVDVFEINTPDKNDKNKNILKKKDSNALLFTPSKNNYFSPISGKVKRKLFSMSSVRYGDNAKVKYRCDFFAPYPYPNKNPIKNERIKKQEQELKEKLSKKNTTIISQSSLSPLNSNKINKKTFPKNRKQIPSHSNEYRNQNVVMNNTSAFHHWLNTVLKIYADINNLLNQSIVQLEKNKTNVPNANTEEKGKIEKFKKTLLLLHNQLHVATTKEELQECIKVLEKITGLHAKIYVLTVALKTLLEMDQPEWGHNIGAILHEVLAVAQDKNNLGGISRRSNEFMGIFEKRTKKFVNSNLDKTIELTAIGEKIPELSEHILKTITIIVDHIFTVTFQTTNSKKIGKDRGHLFGWFFSILFNDVDAAKELEKKVDFLSSKEWEISREIVEKIKKYSANDKNSNDGNDNAKADSSTDSAEKEKKLTLVSKTNNPHSISSLFFNNDDNCDDKQKSFLSIGNLSLLPEK